MDAHIHMHYMLWLYQKDIEPEELYRESEDEV